MLKNLKNKLCKHFHKHGKHYGAIGIALFVGHILFHVVEILILPAILLWLGLK